MAYLLFGVCGLWFCKKGITSGCCDFAATVVSLLVQFLCVVSLPDTLVHGGIRVSGQVQLTTPLLASILLCFAECGALLLPIGFALAPVVDSIGVHDGLYESVPELAVAAVAQARA